MPNLRFLCLHGMGTNANILQAQLEPLTQELTRHNDATFHYIEGTCPSGPGPGVADIDDGPYYSFYPWPRTIDSDDPGALEEAFQLIHETIEEDGPFDGILGFSHGATLAFQFLAHHAKQNPFETHGIFRCAVFICGMPPFRLITGKSKSGHASDRSSFSGTMSDSEPGEEILWVRDDISLVQSSASGALGPKAALLDAGMEGLVSIPTLHVVGREDEICELSLRLHGLCQKENAMLLYHKQGHQVPRDRQTTILIADAVRKLSWQALFG